MPDGIVPVDHIKAAPPSYSGYANGCRCQKCREAGREYHRLAQRRWRARNPGRSKENDRSWREANPDRDRAKQRRYNKSGKGKLRVKLAKKLRTARLQEKVNALKLAAGCKDCGYNKAAIALQFDHIGSDKKMTVSYAIIRWVSERKVMEEIAKCEVVCANCHMIRTHARRLAARGNA